MNVRFHLSHRLSSRPLVATLFWFCMGASHAEVTLLGQWELTQALKKEPPCCVIDARSDAQQSKIPLADALRFRPSLQIVPTASVIVLADGDKSALQVGSELAQRHPDSTIYAVKGGLSTWNAVLKSMAKASSSKGGGASAGVSFVIPHNTCETGTPLQVLNAKPKP